MDFREKKITVLHIIDSFNMGGMENGLLNIINESADKEICHEICCIKKSGEAAGRLKKKIKIYELNKKEGNSWHIYPRLIRVIKAAGPDIVHTRNWGTIDGIIAAPIAGVKRVIHSEHGWSVDDPMGKNIKRRFIRWLLSCFVNQFIAVSEDICRWFQTSCWIRYSKISHIINGVDAKKFKPDDNTQIIKSKLGLSPDDFIIGAVGRFDPIKNFDILIKAFAWGEHKNITLLMVGDGRERSRLARLAKNCGVAEKTIFLGERKDLPELYKIMDVFILPSRNEGISNTILEAMATGLPVIATDVGGNSELVTHNETGILIKPNSVESIVEAIRMYINHPELTRLHGKNSRQKVLTKFTLNRMVSEYTSIYRKLGAK